MRYLDAKKRLALMMAAVKYTRLYMNENPNLEVTNEDIKIAIAKAVTMVPIEYTITLEDLAVVTEGVKSVLLKINQKLKFSSSATIDTKHYDTIKTEDFIIFKEYLKMQNVEISSIEAETIFNTIKTINNIDFAVDQASAIISNDKTNIINEALLYVQQPTIIASDDIFNSTGKLNINPAKLNELSIKDFADIEDYVQIHTPNIHLFELDSAFKTVAAITIELQEIRYRIETDEFITFKANTLLSTIDTFILECSGNTITKEDIVVSPDSSRVLSTAAPTVIHGQVSFDYLACLNISLQGTAKVKNSFTLKDLKSASIVHEAIILSQYNAPFVDRMAVYLGIDSEMFTSGDMAMDFEEFVSVDFSIDTLVTTHDLVELNKTSPLPSEIIAKLYVPNEVRLSLLNGADIMHDYTLTIKDRVVLGRFKLALLRDFDESYLSDIDDLFLDDMIYITTD